MDLASLITHMGALGEEEALPSIYTNSSSFIGSYSLLHFNDIDDIPFFTAQVSSSFSSTANKALPLELLLEPDEQEAVVPSTEFTRLLLDIHDIRFKLDTQSRAIIALLSFILALNVLSR